MARHLGHSSLTTRWYLHDRNNSTSQRSLHKLGARTAGASLDVSDKLIARLFLGGKTTRVCSICVNIVISLSRAAVKTPIWTVTTTATCLPKNLSIGVMPRWTVFHQILPGNVARRRLYKNAFRVFSVITVVLYIIIHWGSRSKSSARMSVEKLLRN